MRSIGTVIFFLTLSLFTSESKAQPFDFGITAGVNISSHLKNFKYFDNNVQLDLKPQIAANYQVGLIGRAKITNSLRFQLEPSVALLGARYDDYTRFETQRFKTKGRTELIYLQVPLLLQLSTVPSHETVYGLPFASTTYHVSGGIFGGYLLDARFTGSNSGTAPSPGDFSNDVSDQYSDYDGGVVLGLGLEHGYKSKFGIEIRGLFSVFDNGNGSNPNFKPQNMAASLSIYYLF